MMGRNLRVCKEQRRERRREGGDNVREKESEID